MPPPLYPALPRLYDALAALAEPCGRWDGGEVSVTDFITVARRHRVLAYLRHSIDRIEGPDELIQALRHEGDALALRVLNQLKGLHDTIGLLERAGIRVLTVKGPALAVQAYGAVTARGPGDLDLWVAPEDVAQALSILTAAGGVYDIVYPSPDDSWVWRYHLRHTCEMTLRLNDQWVDVHWRLSPVIGDLAPFAQAWAERVAIDLPGGQVLTTSPRHSLQHSCGHATRDGWAWLRNLIDVRRLVELTEPSAVASLAPAQRDTVDLTEQLLGGSTPHNTRQRRVMRAATLAQSRERPTLPQVFSARHTAAEMVKHARLNPTPATWARLVAGMAVPSHFLIGREHQSPPVAVVGAFVDRLSERRTRHQAFLRSGGER